MADVTRVQRCALCGDHHDYGPCSGAQEVATALRSLTPAQAAGLAAGTHVVVPVDVLLAVLDEAAADSIYASCKCLSPDEAAISRHHQERIEQLRGLAAAQKEG